MKASNTPSSVLLVAALLALAAGCGVEASQQSQDATAQEDGATDGTSGSLSLATPALAAAEGKSAHVDIVLRSLDANVSDYHDTFAFVPGQLLTLHKIRAGAYELNVLVSASDDLLYVGKSVVQIAVGGIAHAVVYLDRASSSQGSGDLAVVLVPRDGTGPVCAMSSSGEAVSSGEGGVGAASGSSAEATSSGEGSGGGVDASASAGATSGSSADSAPLASPERDATSVGSLGLSGYSYGCPVPRPAPSQPSPSQPSQPAPQPAPPATSAPAPIPSTPAPAPIPATPAPTPAKPTPAPAKPTPAPAPTPAPTAKAKP